MEKGDAASSVSRSYYAMFMAAEAALLTRRVTPSSHRGVIAAFGEQFVKRGLASADDGRRLSRAHEQRLAAEYDPTTAVTYEEAAVLLEIAREFVGKVGVLVGDV